PIGEGTGLGLPAVHGTASAHQGAVGVRSRLGQGSVISLVLPLAEARPGPAAPLPPGGAPTPARVLVVDDEPAVREVVRLALEHVGCQVTTAANGAEAVELFRERRGQLDLVLLDLMLPGMSGAQVFRAVRALDPAARVLLMSGHSEEATEADLLGAGALRLLRKPFTLAELAGVVTAALAGEPRSPAPPATASPR
ncbi:MAG TPA: response regulator, partial [Polyangiaceae bacterium]|nr:response regulator [Polyangiaceae bacterium]